MEPSLYTLVLLPVGLGLLSFVEPCSMGANLLFLKLLEDRAPRSKVVGALTFTLVRAGIIATLGVVAALVGQAFVGAQKTFWIVFGALYLGLGLMYLTGMSGRFMRRIGPTLSRVGTLRSPPALGAAFGFSIPACAAPLLFALFGMTAGTGAVVIGLVSMGLFGLALSLPLVVAVATPGVGRLLARFTGLSARLPRWTGAVLVALGLWSIWFGLYVNPEDWK